MNFQWIDVNEKLPEIITRERHMLVVLYGDDVTDAFWNLRSNKFLSESMGMELSGVTHWAEFPVAPATK